MKKLIVLFAIMLLILSFAGCGNSDGPSGEPAGQSSGTAKGQFESEDIKLINDLYDDEGLELISSIQGNITNIDNGGTFPVIVAGNKVYSEDYGTLKEALTLPDTPDDLIYFDSIEIGENILYFKDGKISLFPYNDYGISFTDMEFDLQTDFIPEISMSSYYMIAHKERNSYILDYYEDHDGTGSFALQSQNPISSFNTSDVRSLSVKDIIPVKSNSSGYCIYVLTSDNDVYMVENTSSRGAMTMTTARPLISNVNKIFASSGLSTYLTVPIYSKSGDSTVLYSAASGEDLTDASDNFEITFALPDGHTPDEVSDIIPVSERLVFVFENGDVYSIDEIEKSGTVSYLMTKLEDVSELNSSGSIWDMAGSSVMDDNLYLLMNDGSLYYRELD